MAKLDRRLLGNTYWDAYRWGIVDTQPAVIYLSPQLAKTVEETVAKDIRNKGAKNVIDKTPKTVTHIATIEDMRKFLEENGNNSIPG